MSEKIVYVSHPSSGLGRSNFPIVCHVSNNRIIRCLPFHIPENVRLYEIKTSRGIFSRPRKEVQMPLAYAWKRRIYNNRVKYPLLRVGWKPDDPRPARRGLSGFERISWKEAIEIVVDQLKRVRDLYGTMEAVLVQADGHGHSGYLQTIHHWGHYLFEKINEKLDWGWWTQQLRNPDSWEGYYYGAKLVWGFDESLGEPWQDAVWDDVLQNAEMVIFSGCDPEATGLGMSGSIATVMVKWLKKAGIKLIAVSPDLNYTAIYYDSWIPIKPNTDAALYMSIAYIWIKESLYDVEYVRTHTVGFEKFAKHIEGEDDGTPKTPEWAERITGIPAFTIKALAREWARKRTTLAVYFGGPKIRGTMGHLAGRLEAYLLAMQGIGKPGRQFLRIGAPSFYKKKLAQVPRYPDVDFNGVPINPLLEYAIGKAPKSATFIPRTLVADAILDPPISWKGTTAAFASTEEQFKTYRFPPRENHPGIRMIWNENSSQSGSWTHGSKWIKALRSPKIEFVVSIHPWLENDALFSDLILPAQTVFEHEDLISVTRSDLYALFYQEKAIEPVGESKSDYEIHRAIAEALGIADSFPEVEILLRRAYEETIAYRKLDINWEEFKKRKFIIYDCPTWEEWIEIKKNTWGFSAYEGGMAWFWKKGTGLETRSGKIEFLSQIILEKDPTNRERPPLAKWIEHTEMFPSRIKKYPYIVMTNHPRFRFHVQGDDVDWIREIWKVKGPDGYEYEPCWINPKDAASKGINDGDIVMVYNERGKVLFVAKLSERIIPGTIYTEHGSRIDFTEIDNDVVDRGGCINLITPSPIEKYDKGETIKIPEMNVSGFLADIKKVNVDEIRRIQVKNHNRKIGG